MHRSGRRSSCAPCALCFAAAVLLANGIAAQTGWKPLREYTGGMPAFDDARGRLVAYDAEARRLWESAGARWVERTPAVTPSARQGAAMVYDSARQRLVLFGGATTAPSLLVSETWEWDGSTWTLRTPATPPPARVVHRMAYDSARQRVVLFGGTIDASGGFTFADTWEWDGANWAQRTPANVPPARKAHAMTYDVARQRVVMFGGSGPAITANLGDTWEWDGVDWLARPAGPPARSNHAIAYDPVRQCTVLFGGSWWWSAIGQLFNEPLGDTWEWDGVAWTQRMPFSSPPTGNVQAIVFDANRQRCVIPGTLVQWEWDGTVWQSQQLVPAPWEHMAFDSTRGRTVMLSWDRTWEWDGGQWRQVATPASPPPRWDHGTAFDLARQRVVVFGGFDGVSPFGDTWTWNGASWSPHVVPGPSPRWSQAMAYDPLRQRVVVFGGQATTTTLNDTWEWNGQAWAQLAPPVSPPAVAVYAAAWDPALQRVLVAAPGQVWSWNGSVWTQHAAPPMSAVTEMAHDTARNRVVLVTLGTLGPTSWEWNGTSWVPLAGAADLEPIGGDVLGRVVGRTRMLTTAQRAATQVVGTGCAGSGVAPRLASNDPYFGNDAFTLEALDAGANAPCIFGLAFATASQPLGAGCTLLLGTPFSLAVAAANASGVARTPPVSIPVVAALTGATLHAQALVFDAAAPLGFTLTARRTLTVGP